MKITWQRPGAQSFAESPWKWPVTVMAVGAFLQIAAPFVGLGLPALETAAGYAQFLGGCMLVFGLLWLCFRKPGRWSGKYQPAKTATLPPPPKRQPMSMRQRWYVAAVIFVVSVWPAWADGLAGHLDGTLSGGGWVGDFVTLHIIYGLSFGAAAFVMGYAIFRLWRMTRTWAILLAFIVPILVVQLYLHMLMSIV